MGEALAAALIVWLSFATLIMAGRHGATLRALWREPVLRRPVLIFESDDWGPGDGAHAEALRRLCAILSRYRDVAGAHPVMTLGMVLALPDRERVRNEKKYAALSLADARYIELRNVIAEGQRRGVFAPQLHGKEHYWPPALMAAAQREESVRAWLEGIAPRTEDLPAPLQSRWIDASVLPARALSAAEIDAAVQDETAEYARVFGAPPAVAVPPTFVWTAEVERAWSRRGVRVIVTPGRRYEGRDAAGKLIAANGVIHNAMHSAHGPVYLVRDDYFEPAKGHCAERVWQALADKSRCGRPTLLEMHRYNFIGDTTVATRACEELARAVEGVLQRFPTVEFMNTERLAQVMSDARHALVETHVGARLHAWCWRVRHEARVWREARITGLAALIVCLRRVTAKAS